MEKSGLVSEAVLCFYDSRNSQSDVLFLQSIAAEANALSFGWSSRFYLYCLINKSEEGSQKIFGTMLKAFENGFSTR